MAPWAVGSHLAYGFAAVPAQSDDICGRCYQLDFLPEAHYDPDPGAESMSGRTMIVQATNIDGDVEGGRFDILIPGGRVGQFDGCSRQWGIDNSELGAQYGGFLTACKDELGKEQTMDVYKTCVQERCSSVFGSRGLTELEDGCNWYVEWMNAADNPNLVYQEVECPQAIIDVSGVHR